jgi:hypothetical protein
MPREYRSSAGTGALGPCLTLHTHTPIAQASSRVLGHSTPPLSGSPCCRRKEGWEGGKKREKGKEGKEEKEGKEKGKEGEEGKGKNGKKEGREGRRERGRGLFPLW